MIKSVPIFTTAVFVVIAACLLSSNPCNGQFFDFLNPTIDIEIPQGKLRGSTSFARNGKKFLQFLNIPYAQPPVGSLRFEPPEPPSNWVGTRQATSYGKSCLQYEFLTHFRTGHEDCLNLNVYTHKVIKPDQFARSKRKISTSSNGANTLNGAIKGLKPVIVYLHGGLFMSGFTHVYRANYFLENDDVVLVTLDYRVNSFGFLNTGDNVVRGNMGLKDQVMALKWVQKNIVYFGGDPNKVTLMGQSAGSASVIYHMLSPMSTGLFHRAISQSGSPLSSWAFSKQPRKQAQNLAEYLNCPTQNSTAMVECLKAKSASEILQYHKDYLDPLPDPLSIFAPSVENGLINDADTFLAESPHKLIKDGVLVNKVPLITGVNDGEGYLCAIYLLKSTKRFNEFAGNAKQYMPKTLGYEDHPNKVEITDKIYDYYFNSDLVKNEEDLIKQLAQFYSEFTFFRGIHDTIKSLSKSTKVYPYYFTYDQSPGITNIQLRMTGNGLPRLLDFGLGSLQRWFSERISPNSIKHYGVAHADELIYQFNIPVINEEIKPDSDNYEFSRDFIKLWLSFAKNGKPSTFKNVEWKPYKSTTTEGSQNNNKVQDTSVIEYFKIDKDPKMISEPFIKCIDFWRSLKLDDEL